MSAFPSSFTVAHLGYKFSFMLHCSNNSFSALPAALEVMAPPDVCIKAGKIAKCLESFAPYENKHGRLNEGFELDVCFHTKDGNQINTFAVYSESGEFSLLEQSDQHDQDIEIPLPSPGNVEKMVFIEHDLSINSAEWKILHDFQLFPIFVAVMDFNNDGTPYTKDEFFGQVWRHLTDDYKDDSVSGRHTPHQTTAQRFHGHLTERAEICAAKVITGTKSKEAFDLLVSEALSSQTAIAPVAAYSGLEDSVLSSTAVDIKYQLLAFGIDALNLVE